MRAGNGPASVRSIGRSIGDRTRRAIARARDPRRAVTRVVCVAGLSAPAQLAQHLVHQLLAHLVTIVVTGGDAALGDADLGPANGDRAGRPVQRDDARTGAGGLAALRL